MSCVRMGDAVVTRVVEWLGDIAPAHELFPDTPPAAWLDHAGLLEPEFWDSATDRCRMAIQTWVVRVDGLTVLVDTGVGNGRNRPQNSLFHHLATPFLQSLHDAGIERNDVDVIVNTHIHLDHVGWNTVRSDDGWTPTFPNARYLVPAADYDYFHPDRAAAMRPATSDDERARFDGMRLIFEDSILPVEKAGQLSTWSQHYQVSPRLSLHAAPGHTPGSSVLWLGDLAVFVGDVLHTPLQIHRPDDRCSFDLDAATARASRRRVLAEARSRGAVVFPSHFPGRGAVSLDSHDSKAFQPSQWINVSSI